MNKLNAGAKMDYKSNNYCRVCLEHLKMDKQLSLNDKFGGIILFTALETLTGVRDLRNDQFTKKICTICAEQIRMAHGVRQKALEADLKLKDSLVLKNELYEEEYHIEDNRIIEDKSDLVEEFLDEDVIYDPLDQDQGNTGQLYKEEEEEDEDVDVLYELDQSKQLAVNGDNSDYDDEEEDMSFDIEAESLHFCCKCTEVFVEEDELFTHFADQHQTFQRVDKPISASRKANRVECLLCGAWSKSLQKHRTLHHTMGPIKYTCKDCGKSFRDIKSRKRCEAKHAGTVDMRLQCPKCPKVLSSSKSLYSHLRAHDKPKREGRTKKVACKICGIVVSYSYLAIHQRIHTGERPFKCEYCLKTFIHKTDHKRHEMSHTGERPYKCTVPSCTSGFVKKSCLKSHIEKRHRVFMT